MSYVSSGLVLPADALVLSTDASPDCYSAHCRKIAARFVLGTMWRPVLDASPGCYAASNEAEVMRIHATQRTPAGHIVPQSRVRGYPAVSLVNADGRKRMYLVSRLVAAAFGLARRPDQTHVAHNDGVPTHNAVTNLRYATPSENQADRMAHGTTNTGRRVLRADYVSVIEDMVACGVSAGVVAELYGCTRANIQHVLGGRTFAKVPRQPV